jgi:hypothetical protein
LASCEVAAPFPSRLDRDSNAPNDSEVEWNMGRARELSVSLEGYQDRRMMMMAVVIYL